MDTTNLQPENHSAPANGEVGKLFRTALGGFHKQDVTDYIERMARDRRRDAERYSAHIRSLEEERAAAVQDAAALRAQAAERTSELYAAQQAKEDGERERMVLRETNEKLERDVADLTGRLSAYEKESASADGMAEELKKVQLACAEKDEEIRKLAAALETEKREKARLSQSLETARRHTVPYGQNAAQSGGAELMNRVRTKTPATTSEVAAMRSRIERARQCAREGLAECNSLYNEMRRNIERLEEILRDLND